MFITSITYGTAEDGHLKIQLKTCVISKYTVLIIPDTRRFTLGINVTFGAHEVVEAV